MSKTNTIEYVKNTFASEGYVLLSNRYINNHQKLQYVCPRNHTWSITWNKWQQGVRCAHCFGNAKKDIDFVYSTFAKEEYRLLSSSYRNGGQKLEYRCPKGHRGSITWHNWNRGIRCVHCSNRPPINHSVVEHSFSAADYILLTDHYTNAHQQLKYTCPDKHEHSMTWNNWQKGKRCPTCYRKYNVGDNHPNWKGGISCEPYCDAWLDKEYKEDIKARDDYRCQNKDCWGISKRLAVHHIDYNKKHCEPWNLITLCNSCNSRANYNRKSHEIFYKNIMERKTEGM